MQSIDTYVLNVYQYIIVRGYLDIIKYLWGKSSINLTEYRFHGDTFTIFDLAAVHGQLHMLQWLRSQDPPCAWN